MQDEAFEFTARLDVSRMTDGDHTGLAMFQKSATGLEIVQVSGTRNLRFFEMKGFRRGRVTSFSVG